MISNTNNRTGITLMEVLISIFVVSIGLLGVAALIPLGGHQTEQGARNDRRANVGRRSFREFMVRGFNRPGRFDDKNWRANNAPTGMSDFVVFNASGEFVSQQAYCLDPCFMAAEPLARMRDMGAEYFPYIGQDVASDGTPVAELTNDGESAESAAGKSMQLPRLTLNSNGAAIVLSQAEELCYFRDDLNFQLPEGNNQNATQTMLRADVDGDNQLDDLKRDAAENYSWFATLFPRNEQWILSTILVRNRNFASVPNGSYGPAPSFEVTGAIVGSVPLPSNPTDQSGVYSIEGDVRVDWGLANSPPTSNMKDGVPVGSWVIIGHDDTVVSTAESFNWYRVVSAGDLEIHAGHAFQDLMLSGPPLIADANMIVGYIVGTEAVYQKTIKLDL